MSHLVSYPAGYQNPGRTVAGSWAPASSAAERRNTLVNGVRVSWLERGNPRPNQPSLVLLHGLIATAETFLPLMDRLGEDRHVIAFDFPANGGSEKLRDGQASMPAIAEWLAAALDHLGLDRPILLGHSHGGAIAMQLAVSAPERVRGLVLMSPAHPFSAHEEILIRFYLSAPGKVFAYALPWFPRWVQLAGFKHMAGPGRWTDPKQLEPYRANLQARGLVPHMLRLLSTWNADMRRLGSALSGGLHVPSLLLWGDRDRAVPDHTAQALCEHLKDSQLIVFPGVGHRPAEEVPSLCVQATETWLAQICQVAEPIENSANPYKQSQTATKVVARSIPLNSLQLNQSRK